MSSFLSTDVESLRKPCEAVDIDRIVIAAKQGLDINTLGHMIPEDEIARYNQACELCTSMAQYLLPSPVINHRTATTVESDDVFTVKGLGLSARQLSQFDGQHAPSVSVMLLEDRKGISIVRMINPTISKLDNPRLYKGEGCLSFPGRYATTKRFNSCTVHYIDPESKEERTLALQGRNAVIAQHEIGHSKGEFFTDHEHKQVFAAKVGANDKCPCGSGIKYKKCCG